MDEYLEKATEFGDGIRILKQDGWEMLISFIISSNNRKPIYNLGTGNQTSLMELAELVNVVGERYNAKAQIVLQDNGTTNTAGVDISLISNDCNWAPIITNEQMIENFFLFD